MRTPRSTAASRAGLIASSSPRSATYRGVGQQPFPTPRRAVAPNPAAIQEPVRWTPHGRGRRICHPEGILRAVTPRRDGGSVLPAPISEIRGGLRGMLRGSLSSLPLSSLSGLLPPLARTFVAAATAFGLFFGEAHAMRCGPTSGLAQQLRARFGEEVIRTEVKPDGSAVMQLWVNRDTRTWTMVLSTVRPRMSCIIGAGRDYDGPLPDEGERL